MIEDINPGTASSAPSFLTPFEGIVFYYANDGRHGNELWSSNGLTDPPDPVAWYNSGGNKMVMDINVTAGTTSGTTLGSSDSSTFLIVFNNKIIFTANDGVNGTELWTVDNSNPPQLLTTINPSTGITYFSRPTIYNGALYFVVDDGVHNRELWRTDGTAAGTSIVYDTRPGTVGAFDNQSPMMVVGQNLFFIANDGLHGAELWRFNNFDTTPPTITSGTYDFDHGQIVLHFSEDVSASLTPDDLKIEWVLPTGTTFSPTDMTWDPLTNTATFTHHPTDAYPSIWPDGNFKLTILGADVTDDTGNAMASNYTLDFWVLAGDANRDRKVDAKDLGILSANWQGTGKVFSQGDFDYDGDVDLIDLYLFSRNRGVTLAAPPPSAAPTSAKRTPARTPIRATIDSLK
jgi:ELWxxDGT repeat protein